MTHGSYIVSKNASLISEDFIYRLLLLEVKCSSVEVVTV